MPERVDHLDLQVHHPWTGLGLVPVHDPRLLVCTLGIQFVLQVANSDASVRLLIIRAIAL